MGPVKTWQFMCSLLMESFTLPFCKIYLFGELLTTCMHTTLPGRSEVDMESDLEVVSSYQYVQIISMHYFTLITRHYVVG
jgi:hypothetical protein